MITDIPTGWHLVPSGPALGGDKYWDPDKKVWLPVTVNQGKRVEDFAAVIRRDYGN